MRIKKDEIDFIETPAKDLDRLGRKKFSNAVADIIERAKEPLVFSVTAKWGTGKTFFCHLLMEELKERKFKVAYFNAWASDFSKDPLPAILGELGALFPEENETLVEVKKFGLQLLKSGIPYLIKILTGNLLNLEGAVQDVASSAANGYMQDIIKEYSDTKKTMKSFREKLSLLVESSTNNKIIVIVDELDRCRPTYAIEVLEIVKHLFSVKGLYFILSMDAEQIGTCVKKYYGNDTDVQGYLNRFIDLNLRLPEPELKKYCEDLFDRFEYGDYFVQRSHENNNEKSQLINALVEISKIYNLSLRDIEKIYTRMTLVFMTTGPSHALFPSALIFLLILQHKDPKTYSRIIEGSTSFPEFVNDVESISARFLYDNFTGIVLSAEMMIILGRGTAESANFMDKLINDPKTEDSRKTWALSVKDHRKLLSIPRFTVDNLGYLKDKIEIASQFL